MPHGYRLCRFFEKELYLERFQGGAVPLGGCDPVVPLFEKRGIQFMGHNPAPCPVFYFLGAAHVVIVTMGDKEVLYLLRVHAAGGEILEQLSCVKFFIDTQRRNTLYSCHRKAASYHQRTNNTANMDHHLRELNETRTPVRMQGSLVLIAWLLFVIGIMLATALPCRGQAVFVAPDGDSQPQTLSVPFGFYNDRFGFAAGYVYGRVGYPQKQSAILGTLIAGTQGSAMGFFFGRDLKIPRTKRLFVDPIVSFGYFEDNQAFVDGNPAFPLVRAGSNDSDKYDFVEGDGWDNFFRVNFKYVLPIGQGRDRVIGAYVIDRGLPIAGDYGGRSWNPLESGKSYLELRPFYRSQNVDGDFFDDEIKTNGLDFSVFWDNRDFFANPSRGFGVRAQVSRDFGWFDSSNKWTNVDGEIDLYLPLGAIGNFRQGVIALNCWTSYSPTWEVQPDGTITDRPPTYAGSTLGGLWRLRGYPSQRFSDKAAVYYSAELRLIPEWNPFEGWPWLQKHVGVQWLQLVPFAELGRVAPTWNLSELHSDMKWSLGFGIRAWAKGLVARIDAAFSDEAFSVQMMVGQPFQF